MSSASWPSQGNCVNAVFGWANATFTQTGEPHQSVDNQCITWVVLAVLSLNLIQLLGKFLDVVAILVAIVVPMSGSASSCMA